jgi:hypothetical protein
MVYNPYVNDFFPVCQGDFFVRANKMCIRVWNRDIMMEESTEKEEFLG